MVRAWSPGPQDAHQECPLSLAQSARSAIIARIVVLRLTSLTFRVILLFGIYAKTLFPWRGWEDFAYPVWCVVFITSKYGLPYYH